MGTPAGLALFDIDGTILDTSLERLFLRFLIRTRRVHLRAVVIRCLRNLPTLDPRLRKWKSVYTAGLTAAELEALLPEWWETSVRPHLYPGIVSALAYFRSRGYIPVFLSGTLRPLARYLGGQLGVDHVIASKPRLRNGTFTGHLDGPSPLGRRKRRSLLSLLPALNISTDGAWAFGNRYSDRFFLELASFPVVIKPGPRLDALARRRRWLILHDPSRPIDWESVAREYECHGTRRREDE